VLSSAVRRRSRAVHGPGTPSTRGDPSRGKCSRLRVAGAMPTGAASCPGTRQGSKRRCVVSVGRRRGASCSPALSFCAAVSLGRCGRAVGSCQAGRDLLRISRRFSRYGRASIFRIAPAGSHGCGVGPTHRARHARRLVRSNQYRLHPAALSPRRCDKAKLSAPNARGMRATACRHPMFRGKYG
jgi:hypothetical protein